MKRVKQEPGGSRVPEERELAYYIHDRVDLMHQVFSLLRSRELRAMGPECVRNLGKEDLMELCLEEVLGISSKRLCAILDGAEPPTDTSSSESDSERLETVSLDSISSDEIQEKDDKKKKKCKRKEEKSAKKSTKCDTDKAKSTKKNLKSGNVANKSSGKSMDKIDDKHSGAGDSRAAERAGMTVLELLELQARARAIRAQLALEHSKKATPAGDSNAAPPPDEDDLHPDSDGSVEIKEEPAQVVELLSSDEEDKKPNVVVVSSETAEPNEAVPERANQPKVTKKNDLTIIVPVTQTHRKVKLNRSKFNTQQTTSTINGLIVKDTAKLDVALAQKNKITAETTQANTIETKQIKQGTRIAASVLETKNKDKKRRIKKVKKISRRHTNDGSDHDEITLQLSDSEKMDLLEDLDRKNYDNVTSSDESKESSEEEGNKDRGSNTCEKVIQNDDELIQQNNTEDDIHETRNSAVIPANVENTSKTKSNEDSENTTIKNINEGDVQCNPERIDLINNIEDEVNKRAIIEVDVDNSFEMHIINTTFEEAKVASKEKTITNTSIEDIPIQIFNIVESNLISKDNKEQSKNCEEHASDFEERHQNCIKNSVLYESCSHSKDAKQSDENCEVIENEEQKNTTLPENHEEDSKLNKTAECSEFFVVDNNEMPENMIEEVIEKRPEEKEKSEGELSDNASSEVEMFEPTEEIVCISDDETPSKKKKKAKKGKEKKSKKEKKKDFRELGDQNFSDESASDSFIEVTHIKGPKASASNSPNINDQIKQISEDLIKVKSYSNSEQNSDSEEIHEISDGDDSCYEVDGVNISKEPTCEEIEALSAKIDTEIEREDIITEEQIRYLENKDKREGEQKEENLEDISWKDRYLDSSKVKKVLKTSSILNAMRKKNIELKKKLAERKKTEAVEKQQKSDLSEQKVEEGSIDHFNTLQASTKYVDPIKKDAEEQENPIENSVQQNVARTPADTEEDKYTVNRKEGQELNLEMKKDAKQLFKMYKRLLKYNDLEKPTDPAKVKKKKNKKQKKNKHLH